MFKLGIDLGGTKIEGIVLGKNNEELFRKRISTEQKYGYEHILNNIKNLYHSMRSEINDQPHTFGIGVPGAVSYQSGSLKNANTECLNGKPLQQDLERNLAHPVAIENDANCFALAESTLGVAQGKDLVFGVIMGTGCGGGIVYQGKVWSGIQSICGEWGHMSIDGDGPNCYCGNRGCVETYISGSGLEKRYQEKFQTQKSLIEIMSDYDNGLEYVQGFIGQFYKNFGRSLANLINVLDPDLIVLGGGVSNIDELYTIGLEQVSQYVFSDSLETPIAKNQLGDSAGVLGAAFIGI